MDAEVQSKEEEQIVSSGTGEIKAGRGSTARKCQMEKARMAKNGGEGGSGSSGSSGW